jgi:4-hydroxythreonine-4-phosphate dehydrogenase
MINRRLLIKGANLLDLDVPKDFTTLEVGEDFKITPSKLDSSSGKFSYESFLKAIELARDKEVDAICTLPIHKEAWKKAGIDAAGHTEVLSKIFHKEAIMMIGCSELFTSFFTHHIPLRDVPKKINEDRLFRFLKDFKNSVRADKIGVLGLNPHAGDGGIMGSEERIITKAISRANRDFKADIFEGPLVPDSAFIKKMRDRFSYYVSMYHDQGLIAIKSLYFDSSINVTLNLPITRVSVDHGTAFDIAYKKGRELSTLSYINAIKEAIRLQNL